MTPSFKHLLITRYNVPLTGWDKDRSGQETRNAEWLAHRQILFENYCVPGIKLQTEKDFTWLIYCDPNTPANALSMIRKSVEALPFVSIRLADDYHACMRDIDHTMSSAGKDYVITSRLDNDDGLAIDYIETVQSHFIPQHNTILNLLNGHGYNVRTHVITKMKNMRHNHFGTLIEKCNPGGGHTSVRGYQHGSPPLHFKTIDIPSEGSWLKTFHERNLKSNAFGYPVFSNSISSKYGINNNVLKHHLSNTLLYTGRWLADGLFRKIRLTTMKTS
jgi:hypothetical protein